MKLVYALRKYPSDTKQSARHAVNENGAWPLCGNGRLGIMDYEEGEPNCRKCLKLLQPDIRKGDRFGRLVVVERAANAGTGHALYACQCDCGHAIIVRGVSFVSGNTTSCGCYHREAASGRARTHGMSGGALGHTGRAPEYQAWAAMLRRCYTTTRADYENYGGRGISVCDRWRESFENFYADMGPRPSPKHSLDRINNDGNYEPSNCRWTTPDVQARNTRTNVNLTFNGKTQTISEWTRELGFERETLRRRIALGWPVEDAFTTPADLKSAKRKSAELRARGLIK